MKKILLFALSLFLGKNSFAQAGALTLDNSSPCDVYVKMYAVDATCGNGLGCDIESNWIHIPASTPPLFYSDPLDFATKVGWASTAGPLSPNCLYNTGTFQWTDARFEYRCNSGTCSTPPTAATNYVNDDGVAPGGSWQLCNLIVQNPWFPPLGSCPALTTWAPASGPMMANVIVTFW